MGCSQDIGGGTADSAVAGRREYLINRAGRRSSDQSLLRRDEPGGDFLRVSVCTDFERGRFPTLRY